MKTAFVRYKKVNIFGGENSGKKCFIEYLKANNNEKDKNNNNNYIYDNELIIQKIQSDCPPYRMFINICSKKFPNYELKKPEIETLIYESELILLIIDVSKIETLKHERNLLSHLLNFDEEKIFIIFNKTDLDYEENNYCLEFKKNFSKHNQYSISLKTKENLEELKNSIFNKLYNNKILNINQLITFEEPNDSKTNLNIQSYLKILVMGNSSVGKSSFINRFFSNVFIGNSMMTTGTDIESINVKISNRLFKLAVWDTAGNEKIKTLPIQYYTNTNAYIILYDVNEQNSLKNIESLINEIKENSNNSIIYIVGNKIDLNERIISKKEGEDFAYQYQIKYAEISCKSGLNVYECMSNVVLDASELSSDISNTFKISIKKYKIKSKNKKNNNGCCQ